MPTILIADEAGLFVALETTPVLRAGCQLVTVRSTHELLARAASGSPDLFLLDADLLGRGTRACLRSLKADRKLSSIPIVIAAKDTSDLISVLSPQDVAFAKPVSPDDVGAALKRLLPVARRMSRRVPISISVVCKMGSRTLKLRTKDLGNGGLFLKTPRGLPEGTTFQASFSLPELADSVPERRSIKATCQVVRRVDPSEEDRIAGVAAVFVSLDEPSAGLIRRFVSARGA